MLTIQYIIRQFYLQVCVFAGPEDSRGVEDIKSVEGPTRPTVSPESLPGNADKATARVEANHRGLESKMMGLSEAESREEGTQHTEGIEASGNDTREAEGKPQETGDDLREDGLQEVGHIGENESENPLDSELRSEIITAMGEDERRDFESKTPEEQQEYLEAQIQDREHRELLDAMTDLGIEGLDIESLESVFGDMNPEEIAEFESMSLEEQGAFMQERHTESVARAEEIIVQERGRLEAEARSASPQRQTEIGRQVARLGQMGEAIRGGGPGNQNFFRGEAGTLTPEQIAEFGRTGEQLAQYASTCTPATNERFYCGKNTGEALNGFYRSIGKPELQINDRPRHGYVWSEMLAARSNEYREISVNPSEAPAGAIISYAAGPGGSSAFSQYGHVEIALGNGSYYFGQIAQSPGGSRRPPVEGQYRVFMPVALGNNEGLPPETVSSTPGNGVR